MSGRSLRRLPVLAHAKYVGTMSLRSGRMTTNGNNGAINGKNHGEPGLDVNVWLDAMERVMENQKQEKERLLK